MSAPRPRPHPRPLAHLAAVVVADDPWVCRHATELLGAAGFPLRETAEEVAGPGDDELLVLLLSRDAAARVEAIAEHVERRPGAAVVAAMPGAATGGMLRRALRAGADGIVFDEQVDRALVATVRAVTAGQLTVPLAMRRRIAPRPLSYREKEILSLVVQGFTNRQIADKLFLAESTVKTHLSSAFGKLDARSRSEAAALVLDPDGGFELGLPIVGTPSAA
jgi:DNA-binding NarL/FixJ family response regulator